MVNRPENGPIDQETQEAQIRLRQLAVGFGDGIDPNDPFVESITAAVQGMNVLERFIFDEVSIQSRIPNKFTHNDNPYITDPDKVKEVGMRLDAKVTTVFELYRQTLGLFKVGRIKRGRLAWQEAQRARATAQSVNHEAWQGAEKNWMHVQQSWSAFMNNILERMPHIDSVVQRIPAENRARILNVNEPLRTSAYLAREQLVTAPISLTDAEEIILEDALQATLEQNIASYLEAFPDYGSPRDIHTVQIDNAEKLEPMALMLNVTIHDLLNKITSYKGYSQLIVKRGNVALYNDLLQLMRAHHAVYLANITSELAETVPRQRISVSRLVALAHTHASYQADLDQLPIIEVIHPMNTGRASTIRDMMLTEVVWSERRYHDLLENTTLNARKAGANSVKVSFAARDDMLEITVDDDGHGLPETIEIEGFQVDVSSWQDSTVSGAGVAMAGHRQQIEQYGGELHAFNRRDDQGKILGARILIRIPFKQVA